ncbi:MAG TPA: PHP domain-containing protein, partial [Thermomicrobiales bacterium]|nr:PHP domain-containing protein [Thermomicrobiales bacterium]
MSKPTDYVELHLHTAFSLLDGASLPEELIGRAVDFGYPALAVTDHDGLYGAMEFAQAARAAGIAPIVGAELTLADETHLTLLAESAAGYANLCRLLTAAYRGPHPDPRAAIANHPGGGDADARRPRLDPALLPAHADGLILLTGCRQGRLSQLVDAGEARAAAAELDRYLAWFGPANVAVELQHNLVYGDTRRVRALADLAAAAGVAAVATGDVHYHRRERHRLQDVLVAIRCRTTLDGSHRCRRPNAEFALQPPAVMAERFARYPDAIRATRALAERCAAFDLTRDLAYRFPDYAAPTGETPDAYLARVCWEALAGRYADRFEPAAARLTEELRLIARHGLAGFFLLYRDLLGLAR